MDRDLRLAPGTVFARDFRIVSLLAEGGMGAVYVVEQVSTAKARALKVMHPHFVKEPRNRERFETEAHVSSRIDSDHVVEVVGAGVDDVTGVPWLAMELLRGETLTEVVKTRGALAPADVLEVFRQLCHALGEAHRIGLVHRDLKPDNVFLAASRRSDVAFTVKVLDFGIAKWLQDSRTAAANSQTVGTPLWMAPEQVETGQPISSATDVWALGLIVFYLLTGRMYWHTANAPRVSLSAILAEMMVRAIAPASQRAAELGYPHPLPAGFDEWFARCVNRSVSARFRTADETLAVLAPVLAAAPSRGAGTPAVTPGVVLAPTLVHAARERECESGPGHAARGSSPSAPPGSDASAGGSRLPQTVVGAPEPFDGPEETEAQVTVMRRTLALDPSDRAALGGLVDHYGRVGDWPRAADVVSTFLRQNAGRLDREAAYRLHYNLGMLYRDHLRAADAAAQAFAAAAEAKPDDPVAYATLARLFGAEGDARRAVGAWQRVLSLDPTNAEALGALFDAYTRLAQPDAAYCAAATAVYLLRDEARADVRACYQSGKPQAPAALSARLDDATFLSDVVHPDQDPHVGRILALLLPTLRRLKQHSTQAFGLRDTELEDPQTSAVPLVRYLGTAAHVLGVQQPPVLYLRRTQPGGVAYAPSEPWASVIGFGLLQGMTPEELLFVAGRHMAYYRPEHYARVLFPSPDEVAALVLAAVRVVAPDFDAPAEIRGTIQTLQTELPRDGVNLEALRTAARAFRDRGANRAAVERWFRAVELTACQAGFLLAGDLRAVSRLTQLDPGLPADRTPAERLRAVLSFAVSERYVRLRAALGIAVQ